MKHFAFLFVLAALLCALALPAAADVAYMPRDDFYEKHMSDCRYVSRYYYTNGPEGYVLAHKTPDSAEATPLPNGRKYYLSYVYKDKWGVVEYDPATLENRQTSGCASGWVKMSEMVPEYDSSDFYSDHYREFVDKTVELEFGEKDTIFCYLYPGSGELKARLDGSFFYLDPPTFHSVFVDPAGREWGYLGYYYGYRDLWICLDDPFNSQLPPDENHVEYVFVDAQPTETPAPTAAPTDTPASPAPTKTVTLTPPADDQTLRQAAKDHRGSGPYIAAGGAGVVVVAAAVLIAALRKKKR